MATYTNRKNGSTLETSLNMRQALDILRPKSTDESVKEQTRSFIKSLIAAANSGNLRGDQTYWFYKMAEDFNPNKPRINNSVELGANFGRIQTMFKTAKDNGLTRPKLYLKDNIGNNITLSLAPESGNNPGCIYVKREGEYCGKVTQEGEFLGTRDCPDSIKSYLQEFAENPFKMAQQYGRETGICCCCGRTLTNKESIDLGIGPICQGKYGM